MRAFSILLMAFLLPMISTAQTEPIKEIELKGKGKAVFMHTRTGIPIFQTLTHYVAMNPNTFEKMWEVKRQEAAKMDEVSAAEDRMDDYFELPTTTLAYLGNSFIDVIDGTVLVDGFKDELRSMINFNLFPEMDLMLVKVTAKGSYRVYAFNPIEKKLLWKADIDEASGLTQVTSSGGAFGIKPFISEHGDIVYTHKKDMMLIDPKTGKVAWSEKLEPGEVMFSNDGKRIAVVEERSGLGAMMSVMTLSFEKKLGKKLVVIDAATGENSWKKEIKMDGNVKFLKRYKNGFVVVHDEGFNIYDFNSAKGEGLWKKDFGAKNISDVVFLDDGNFMVYYKNKRMLMDPETGKELWKKAEKLEREIPVYGGGDEDMLTDKIKMTDSGRNLTFYHKTKKKYRSFAGEFYIVDQERNQLVALAESNPEATKIGAITFNVSVLDLESFDVARGSISINKGIVNLEAVESGYFVSGPVGFVLFKVQGGNVETITKEKYPEPGAFGRTMANIGIGTAYVYGATAAGNRAAEDYIIGGDEQAMQRYEDRMETATESANAASTFVEGPETRRDDREFAYFFSKSDNGNLALFQIRKADGSEAASYKFNDKTPVYEVDYRNERLYYLAGNTLKIYELKS